MTAAFMRGVLFCTVALGAVLCCACLVELASTKTHMLPALRVPGGCFHLTFHGLTMSCLTVTRTNTEVFCSCAVMSCQSVAGLLLAVWMWPRIVWLSCLR